MWCRRSCAHLPPPLTPSLDIKGKTNQTNSLLPILGQKRASIQVYLVLRVRCGANELTHTQHTPHTHKPSERRLFVRWPICATCECVCENERAPVCLRILCASVCASVCRATTCPSATSLHSSFKQQKR